MPLPRWHRSRTCSATFRAHLRDAASFEILYGPGLPVAGTFAEDSALNNGGDRLKLEDAASGTVKEFRYDDDSPWPVAADGDGYSDFGGRAASSSRHRAPTPVPYRGPGAALDSAPPVEPPERTSQHRWRQ